MKGFSFFCGAGGSSIGYKQAGIDIIGGCDIDLKQILTYQKYQNPKIMINDDIRSFIDNDYSFMYNLDIIDGSPPCTNFSKSNTKRSNKQFKELDYIEGSVCQKIEELTLIYLQVVYKYQPKFFILENVINLNKQYKTLLNDYIYKSKIQDKFELICTYLDPKDLGAYTSRPRLFIIGVPKHSKYTLTNINKTKFNMDEINKILEWEPITAPSILNIYQNLKKENKKRYFERVIVDVEDGIGVITTSPIFMNPNEPKQITIKSLAKIQGFNYDFNGYKNSNIAYSIGMSVHPYCTKYIADILLKYDLNNNNILPLLNNDFQDLFY